MKKFRIGLVTVFISLFIFSGCNAGTPAVSRNENLLENTQPAEDEVNLEDDQGGEVEAPTQTLLPADSDINQQAPEDSLSGIPIDIFFEEAFKLILENDPEWLVDLGLKDTNAEEPILTDFSPHGLEKTVVLYRSLLDTLRTYPFDELGKTDQVSYRVFETFLVEEIHLKENAKFEYLVTPLSVRSKPQLFIMFFTDSHPLITQSDAEAFVARVHLLDEKIDQLIARLEDQEQAGVIAPKMILEYGRGDLKRFTGENAQASPILQIFRSKTEQIEGFDPELRSALDEELLDALKTEVYPAFQRLDSYLAELQVNAPDVVSLSHYEGGLDYYQTLLKYFSTTELTADEIHDLGLSELDRIQAEIRQKFIALGYPQNEDMPALYERMIKDSGTLVGDAVTETYEDILQAADESLENYFDLRPAGVLEVVGGNEGAYYSPGSLDGLRPGKFFARITSPQEVFKLKTIAYHEGIPGHHYQISVAAQSDLPFFRNLIAFDGYVEGWALYAEYLAYELGWYQDDLFGDLGRLQYEALRAARMVVDTGIHAKGWDYQQAVNFLRENTGLPAGMVEYEVIRYIGYPGQAPAYMLGKLKILELRQMAQDQLGDAFDLREFHNVVLQNGSVPLTVLETIVAGWVAAQ